MNDARHIQPTRPAKTHRQVEYLPPSAETIRRYGHAVSRQLYKETIAQASFTELSQGFTEFVRVLVRIQMKALNRRNGHV